MRCQAVVAPSTLLRFLDPPSDDPSVLLQSVEQRIERSHMKSQSPARSELNQLRNVIPMARLILEQREHEKLGAALFPLGVRQVRRAGALSHASPTIDDAGWLRWRALHPRWPSMRRVAYTSVHYMGPHKPRRANGLIGSTRFVPRPHRHRQFLGDLVRPLRGRDAIIAANAGQARSTWCRGHCGQSPGKPGAHPLQRGAPLRGLRSPGPRRRAARRRRTP